jgi:Reverse transcriptase (RNA-dependent DNA polymerase).
MLLRWYKKLTFELDMNGTLQVLAYEDDVNLIGDDNRTIERNAEVLLNACKDIGLEVNILKTKYMEIVRHLGMIANTHIKIGTNSYEKVKTFNDLRGYFPIVLAMYCRTTYDEARA